jgi:hypothetical protein
MPLLTAAGSSIFGERVFGGVDRSLCDSEPEVLGTKGDGISKIGSLELSVLAQGMIGGQ